MRNLRRIVSPALLGCGWLLSCSANDPSWVQPNPPAVDASDGTTLDVSLAGDQEAKDTSVTETGGYDALPEVAEGSCGDGPPAVPTVVTGRCATPLTENECDGVHDPTDLQGHTLPNGLTGNGYDDDCDGLVDEGCACDAQHPAGTVKDCYILPSSWVDPLTLKPVGWCEANSKGTVKCVAVGGTPEFPILRWDGVCRGAQPPFSDDVCAPGDFNCDGVAMNPTGKDCACELDPVHCPTEPLLMNPFPDPNNLSQKDSNNPLVNPTEPFVVDGLQWIDDPYKQDAKGWSWEITGGDCDNILPHPTFSLYGKPQAATANRLGKEVKGLGPSHTEHGYLTLSDDAQHQVYPAFSLSGDYLIQSRFYLLNKLYECTVKVQVRAPGIRAELCWDHVGMEEGSGGNDVDLHFGRLQGNDTCQEHGWFRLCGNAPQADDCYFHKESGCGKNSTSVPGWGYDDSHDAACHGWGSLRPSTKACTNPRLDRDNLYCRIDEKDPNAYDPEHELGYCGPENINLDNPNPGDRFLVGAHCFNCVDDPHPKTHPHVNVYCNGERRLSAGYDPRLPLPQFPVLDRNQTIKEGGAFWTVAWVEWTGNADLCSVKPVPSQVPNTATDGSSQYCVEKGPQNEIDAELPWYFLPGGGVPTSAVESCWH